jgi:hypothetical protein
VNQVFVVSVNCAGPTGKGLSMIVDPEGNTIAAADGEAPVLLTAELDLAAVEHVRTHGTETSTAPGPSSATARTPSNCRCTRAGSGLFTGRGEMKPRDEFMPPSGRHFSRE